MSNYSVAQPNQRSTPQDSTPLFVPGRAKPVAFLNGRTLKKGIQPQHILNKPRAICFDASVIEQAQAAGAMEIIVKCEATTYSTTMQRFRRYAFPLNRLAGRQWGLELCRWSVNGATPELDRREQVQAMKESQMSLFGDVA